MDPNELAGLVGLGGVFVVVGLVEVLKRVLRLPALLEPRVLPLFALALGVLWNALLLRQIGAGDTRWETILVYGLAAGLGSMGLWSGTKALAGK